MTVDALMASLMLLVMAYQVTGGTAHEIAGITLLALFILHNALNAKWYRSLGKGRYDVRRIVWTTANILLLLSMLISMISGIIISRTLFAFHGLDGGLVARQIHTAAAYWGLLFASIHVGLHWQTIENAMFKPKRIQASRARTIFTRTAAVSLAVWGIKSSFDRNVGQKLIMYASFDYFDPSSSRLLFALSHFSIMALYVCVTHFAIKAVARRKIFSSQYL